MENKIIVYKRGYTSTPEETEELTDWAIVEFYFESGRKITVDFRGGKYDSDPTVLEVQGESVIHIEPRAANNVYIFLKD